MADTLWRLAWALPLVLAVGFVAVLLLKRFGLPVQAVAEEAARRMNLRESLTLSEDTRVHLIEVDRKTYLVVESARQAVLQPSEVAAVPVRTMPAWAQRLYKSRSR